MKTKHIIFRFVLKSLLFLFVAFLAHSGYAQDADSQKKLAEKQKRLAAGFLAVYAGQGKLDGVKSMLVEGAPVNGFPGDSTSTALMNAAQAGFGSYLYTADTNFFRGYDRREYTPPVAAEKYVEIALLLLDSGANVNASERFGRTALMAAASSGAPEMVQLLLDRGAEVEAKDVYGATALMIAARRNSVEIVRLLLKSGAQVNAANGLGYTSLMAASLGYLPVVELLLSEGADVNATTKEGATTLMLAADAERYDFSGPSNVSVIKNYDEKIKIIDLLLSKGAKINARTQSGSTALLRAIHSGAVSAVQLLLDKGANPNFADKWQGTPVQLAARLRNKWIKLNRTSRNGQELDAKLKAQEILDMVEQATAKQPKPFCPHRFAIMRAINM